MNNQQHDKMQLHPVPYGVDNPIVVTPAHTPPVLNPTTGQVTPSPVIYAVNPYKNTTCITALILGLCTFISFGATGIPAVVTGHIALTQCRQGRANQQGLAITGLVLGYAAVVGWCLWWLFMLVGLIAGGQS